MILAKLEGENVGHLVKVWDHDLTFTCHTLVLVFGFGGPTY